MKNQESKRKMLYLAFALMMTIAMTSTATAKSWRINNNTSLKPHFTTINAAMSSDEVQDGDTLYLDPGCTLSSTQTVSKAVTVVGTGYFLDALPYNQASITGTLTISAEKSKLVGISSEIVNINANNVAIERCQISFIESSKSNIIIRSSFIRGNHTHSYNSDVRYKVGIHGSDYWTIENCIIIGTCGHTTTPTISGLKYSTIRNNYIRRFNFEGYSSGYSGYFQIPVIDNISNCELTNNIIINESPYSSSYVFGNLNSCIVTNNILSCGTLSSYPINKYSATTSSVFVSSGSNDLAYKLSSTSPAKGYATDGGDCGPYGSGYTYVPSGLPFGHPYYTQIQVGSPAQKGKLNVTYKVKVQDE